MVNGECSNIVTFKNILSEKELNNNIIILYLISFYCVFVKVGFIVL
jgi:hypothetical protein